MHFTSSLQTTTPTKMARLVICSIYTFVYSILGFRERKTERERENENENENENH